MKSINKNGKICLYDKTYKQVNYNMSMVSIDTYKRVWTHIYLYEKEYKQVNYNMSMVSIDTYKRNWTPIKNK